MAAAPKTLLQMAGANPAPPPLSESTVVVIDAQREYTDGKLPLTNVRAGARRNRQAAAARPCTAGAGDPYRAPGQAGRRVRTGHTGLRGRLAGDAGARRSRGVEDSAERLRVDRPREPVGGAEEAERRAGRLHDTYVRRGHRTRIDRSRLQGDRGRKRHRDPPAPRPARRPGARRGRSPTQRTRGDRGSFRDRVPEGGTRCPTSCQVRAIPRRKTGSHFSGTCFNGAHYRR